MEKNKSKIYSFYFLPHVDKLMQLFIIRTNRKTVEVSITPYKGCIVMRVPKDTQTIEIHNILLHHTPGFIESVENYQWNISRLRENNK